MSDRQLAAVGNMWPQQLSQPMRMAKNAMPIVKEFWMDGNDLEAEWLLDLLDVAEEPGAHNLLKLGGTLDQWLKGTDKLQSELSN